jgi:hypothetical protein
MIFMSVSLADSLAHASSSHSLPLSWPLNQAPGYCIANGHSRPRIDHSRERCPSSQIGNQRGDELRGLLPILDRVCENAENLHRVVVALGVETITDE